MLLPDDDTLTGDLALAVLLLGVLAVLLAGRIRRTRWPSDKAPDFALTRRAQARRRKLSDLTAEGPGW